MKQFIAELRERPEQERFIFAAFAAGAVGILLFLLWGFTFFSGSGNEIGASQTAGQNQQASAASSLEESNAQLRGAWGDVSEQYGNVRETLEEARRAGQRAVELSTNEDGEVEARNVYIEENSTTSVQE